MKNNTDIYIYQYVVYWMGSNMDLILSRVKRTYFTNKRDAKIFAKKHKKDNDFIKPAIIKSVSLKDDWFVKPESKIEIVKNKKHIEDYCGNRNFYKEIKY